MQTKELLPTDGLDIEREAFDRSLITRAEQECPTIFSLANKTIRIQRQGETDKDTVTAYVFNVEDIIGLKLPSINAILEALGRTSGYMVSFNYQAPHSNGGFHVDERVAEPTVIIQLSNDGVFDSVIGEVGTDEEAEQKAVPINVNMGDKLTLLNGSLVHRGRNPSDHDRYNMVVWKPAQPQTMEEILRESASDTWN